MRIIIGLLFPGRNTLGLSVGKRIVKPLPNLNGGALFSISDAVPVPFLASMKRGKWKLYGIEMDDATAQKAMEKSGANVSVGNVMDAPFPPNSFDVITAFDVLEHVYHPREFLNKFTSG